MAIHSRMLVWEIPWTGEPGGPKSMGSQKSRTPLSDRTIAITPTQNRCTKQVYSSVCCHYGHVSLELENLGRILDLQVIIIFIYLFIYLFIYFLGCTGMWDNLSSLTRDRTQAPLHQKHRVLTTEPPGKSQICKLFHSETFLSFSFSICNVYNNKMNQSGY